LYVRVLVCDQEVITKFHLCIEEKLKVAASANLRVRVGYYSCGNKWGTCGSKSSWESSL